MGIQGLTAFLATQTPSANIESQIASLQSALSSQSSNQSYSASASVPLGGGSSNTIALASAIDQLSGTAITNPSITGGSITNASFSGGTVSATSLSAGASTLATTTITGGLALTGGATFDNATTSSLAITSIPWGLLSTDGNGNVVATSSPTALSFTATSATATSTFAGGITGPNNFTVQQSSGFVGIGTISPLAKVDIEGQITPFPATAPRAENSMMVLNNTVGVNPLEIHSANALGIDLYTNADADFRAPYMNFYKSRGTQTAPTPVRYTGYELDSIGGINFGGWDGSSYFPGAAAILTQSDENWTPTAHGAHLSIYFTRLGASSENQIVQFGGLDASGVDGNDTLFNWPINFYSNSATGVKMSGDGSGGVQVTRGDASAGANFDVMGKIGIGTTTPWALLSVSAPNNSSLPELIVGSSTATSLFVSNSGNVGIGTTTPATALDIVGTLTLENRDYTGVPSDIFIQDGSQSLPCAGNGTNGSANSVFVGGGTTNGSGGCPDGSVIIGHGAQTFGSGNSYYQVVIGMGAQTTINQPKDTVIGAQAISSADNNVAIGYNTKALSSFAIAVGSGAVASSSNDIAIGNTARVTGANSASFGYTGIVSNSNSYVFGNPSTLSGFGTPTPLNRIDVSGSAAIGSYAGVNTAPTNGLIVSGNVGIGTTTPLAKLDVAGANNITTPLFQLSSVASYATTTEFVVNNNGSANLAGTLTQNSDQRLKTNVTNLDASSSLAAVNALNPVTFNWIDPAKSSVPQYGFIAQDVQKIFPSLIAITSPTALTPDGTLSLNYIDLIAPVVKAIQALSSEIALIENTIAGFAQSITSQKGNFTNELCVGSTCVTPAQFQAMVAAANQSAIVSASTSTATDTPPVIAINGNNPATVQVGASYTDLGATITGPEADLNLGIKTFLNGMLASTIVLDTTAAATDTIDYVVTDTAGNAATSTRTVIVQPAHNEATRDASSSDATSTGQ